MSYIIFRKTLLCMKQLREGEIRRMSAKIRFSIFPRPLPSERKD